MNEKAQLIIDYSRQDLITFAQAIDQTYNPNWHHEEIANALMKVESGEIKRLMLFLPPRHGKQVANHTPILTTKGWTTHGKLREGDFVFGREGKPIEVLAISDETPSDYLIKFSDGTTINCHGNHEWLVYDRGLKKERVVETKYLAKRVLSSGIEGKRGHRYIIQVDENQPIHFERRHLIIHPYWFGVWLGDGTSSSGTICCCKKDVNVIKKCSEIYEPSSHWVHKTTGVLYFYFSGLRKLLRKIGVYENKHIPEEYKRSSIQQRLELLAGIVDTDGHKDEKDRYRVSTVSKKFAEDIAEVVRSLGGNPYIMSQIDTKKRHIISKKICYQVGFNLRQKLPCILKRKQNKEGFIPNKRGIVSVEKIDNTYCPLAFGKCIQVDSEDGIYLVGENLIPTHNSRLATEIFPTWYLGRNPNKEVITASNTEDLAKDFGRKAREIVAEPLYNSIFNIGLKQDEKSASKWRTSLGGSYTSVGIGGTITGRGAHLLIIDDPIKNAEDAQSVLFRNKQWDWYRSVAYTRLMKNASVIIILTRWHTDDIAGRLLEQAEEGGDKWHIIKFPAIAEEDEKFRKKGEALWQSEFPLKKILEIKRVVGPYVFSSLYQQEPITNESQLFSDSWFKYRDACDVDALSTRNFLTIDTAVSQTNTADYTGFCDNRVDAQNFWNLSAWRERINPKDLLDKLFFLHQTNRYEKIGIEKTMYTQVIQPFLDEEMRKRNQFLPIVELQHGGVRKEERIKWLVARYSSGSIYHIRGKTQDLEEELVTFPKSKFDDVSDAVAYQTQIAQSSFENTWEEEEELNFNTDW